MVNQSEFISPYTPNTDTDREEMLAAIGVGSVDELFEDIPLHYRNPQLDLPGSMSELELRVHINDLVRKNVIPGEFACFLGAGSYRHHIPAIVQRLISRGEYMTAYTPYQPEVSQGTLQTEYEFQTLCCLLTGMPISNAGMYDGATALAEGALMACRVTRRNKVAVLKTVSPFYVEVMKTYTESQGIEIYFLDEEDETLQIETACLVIQQPNFLGYLRDVELYANIAHEHGALLVSYVDPISLGMFKPPGDYDADIVASEGQALGVPTAFGGPYVGIFACKEQFIRQMPGRIVGKTVDTEGQTAYVLTLQTREQHIRRERATSNICTSVALIALMSTIYMAANGKRGMKNIAELCYQKSHYAMSLIKDIPGFSVPVQGTFFQEFVILCPFSPSLINQRLLDYRVIGGLDLNKVLETDILPEPNGMLISVTEMNSRSEIETLAHALAEISKDQFK